MIKSFNNPITHGDSVAVIIVWFLLKVNNMCLVI